MRFLAATDGSDPGEKAVSFAIEMASEADASVTIVSAVSPEVRSAGGSEPPADIGEANRRLIREDETDAEDRAERILSTLADRFGDQGVEIRTETLYGDPEVVVPEFAEGEGYDAIFVGHRGLSERAEEALGSVAKGIVERSAVPVTVVGPDERS